MAFDYDRLGRLDKWRRTDNTWVVDYDHDDSGNLTGRTVTSGSTTPESIVYGYSGPGGGPNAVKTTPWGQYVYGTNGNLEGIPTGAVTYTPSNLPKTITGSLSTTFDYDADDQRVVRRDSGIGNVVRSPSGVCSETLGSLCALRTRRERRSGVGGAIQRFDGFRETTSFIHIHDLGSVSSTSDASGVAYSAGTMDPFGNRVAIALPTLLGQLPQSGIAGPLLGITGHREDEDLGLVNMGGRVYSPRLGRLTTPDPLLTDSLVARVSIPIVT